MPALTGLTVHDQEAGSNAPESSLVPIAQASGGPPAQALALSSRAVPWRVRVRQGVNAPRGSKDGRELREVNQGRVARVQAQEGDWRACPQCSWARFVPFGCRQQHCLFPGRGPWRCGKQLAASGWLRCQEIPADLVAARNDHLREAFESLRRTVEPPRTAASRSSFFLQLQASARWT